MSHPFRSKPRTLVLLSGATLLSILLAVFAVHRQAQEGASAYKPVSVLPGFAAHVRGAASIRIVSKLGSLDIAFVPDKGWVVPSRDNYPASFDVVHRTLVGLASMQTIAPKTGRADWLHYIGLDAPPNGDGVLFTISDDKGQTLAALVTGKSQDIGDPSGATGLFVRKPDENQAFLARSFFTPVFTAPEWLDKTLLNIDQKRIREVDVDPAHGVSYEVRREKTSDEDFTLDPIPKGRVLDYSSAPDSIAGVLVGFDFADVHAARDFDFSGATRVVTKTFDGLSVTLDAIQKNGDTWVMVSAASVSPETAKEAGAINAHAAGWAYNVSADIGKLLTTTRDSLLRPAAAPVKMGQPAH